MDHADPLAPEADRMPVGAEGRVGCMSIQVSDVSPATAARKTIAVIMSPSVRSATIRSAQKVLIAESYAARARWPLNRGLSGGRAESFNRNFFQSGSERDRLVLAFSNVIWFGDGGWIG